MGRGGTIKEGELIDTAYKIYTAQWWWLGYGVYIGIFHRYL
jgi:hypothetical protein